MMLEGEETHEEVLQSNLQRDAKPGVTYVRADRLAETNKELAFAVDRLVTMQAERDHAQAQLEVLGHLDRIDAHMRSLAIDLRAIRRSLGAGAQRDTPLVLELNAFLAEFGWSQRRLSRESGMHQATLSRAVNGNGTPSEANISRLRYTIAQQLMKVRV